MTKQTIKIHFPTSSDVWNSPRGLFADGLLGVREQIEKTRHDSGIDDCLSLHIIPSHDVSWLILVSALLKIVVILLLPIVRNAGVTIELLRCIRSSTSRRIIPALMTACIRSFGPSERYDNAHLVVHRLARQYGWLCIPLHTRHQSILHRQRDKWAGQVWEGPGETIMK